MLHPIVIMIILKKSLGFFFYLLQCLDTVPLIIKELEHGFEPKKLCKELVPEDCKNGRYITIYSSALSEVMLNNPDYFFSALIQLYNRLVLQTYLSCFISFGGLHSSHI